MTMKRIFLTLSKEKGQDQINLALKICSSTIELPFDSLNLTSLFLNVNCIINMTEKRLAPLMSEPFFLRMPLAGVEPASSSESKGSSHPLSYRGILSGIVTVFDKLSNVI